MGESWGGDGKGIFSQFPRLEPCGCPRIGARHACLWGLGARLLLVTHAAHARPRHADHATRGTAAGRHHAPHHAAWVAQATPPVGAAAARHPGYAVCPVRRPLADDRLVVRAWGTGGCGSSGGAPAQTAARTASASGHAEASEAAAAAAQLSAATVNATTRPRWRRAPWRRVWRQPDPCAVQAAARRLAAWRQRGGQQVPCESGGGLAASVLYRGFAGVEGPSCARARTPGGVGRGRGNGTKGGDGLGPSQGGARASVPGGFSSPVAASTMGGRTPRPHTCELLRPLPHKGGRGAATLVTTRADWSASARKGGRMTL